MAFGFNWDVDLLGWLDIRLKMKRNTEKDKGKGRKENFNLFLSPYLPYAFVSASFINSKYKGWLFPSPFHGFRSLGFHR